MAVTLIAKVNGLTETEIEALTGNT
jgi:hypothetical protein